MASQYIFCNLLHILANYYIFYINYIYNNEVI